MITLHLVRHAEAFDAEASGSDAARRLTPRGTIQARTVGQALRLTSERLDLVCASPRLRALETAALLAPDGVDPLALDALALGEPAVTAAALARAQQDAGATTLAAVGHEPSLSALATYLLTGQADAFAVAFRKGAVLTLQGRLAAGGMTLGAFLPIRATRDLLGATPEDGQEG